MPRPLREAGVQQVDDPPQSTWAGQGRLSELTAPCGATRAGHLEDLTSGGPSPATSSLRLRGCGAALRTGTQGPRQAPGRMSRLPPGLPPRPLSGLPSGRVRRDLPRLFLRGQGQPVLTLRPEPRPAPKQTMLEPDTRFLVNTMP